MQAMRMRRLGYRAGSMLSGAALLAGTALGLGASVAGAQAPPSVPLVRFYGTVTLNGGPAPTGTTVTAQSASSPTTVCGTGSVNAAGGAYFVDIQSIAGCSGNLVFVVNGQPTAGGPVTPPALQGSSQRLNLTVAAATPSPTPPPPPPPAPPTPVATQPPPAPPPPPPVITPSPSPTATPRPAVTASPAPVIPAGPPNTGVGPGPSRSAPPASSEIIRPAQAPVTSAPAVVAPAAPVQVSVPAVAAPAVPVQVAAGPVREGAIAAAPAVAPGLPNTGSGGLLQSRSAAGFDAGLFAGVTAVAGLLLISAATAFRRSR